VPPGAAEAADPGDAGLGALDLKVDETDPQDPYEQSAKTPAAPASSQRLELERPADAFRREPSRSSGEPAVRAAIANPGPAGQQADPARPGDLPVPPADSGPAPGEIGDSRQISAGAAGSPEARRVRSAAVPAPEQAPETLAGTPDEANRAAPATSDRLAGTGATSEEVVAPMRLRLGHAIASAGSATVVPFVQATSGSAAVPAPALAPPLAAPDPATTDTVTPSIVRAMSLSWRDGVGEARVRLEPESLGTVTVALRVERGVVTATLTSDVAAVRDSIYAHERELRAGLAAHGLDLDRLVVTADPDRERRDQDASQGHLPRRNRHQASRRLFELDA
jgi:flagellar hook-length control protein FliK